MMNKKQARLYQRIQFGRARKEEANEALRRKREEAEKKEQQATERRQGRGKRAAVVAQQPIAVAKRKRV